MSKTLTFLAVLFTVIILCNGASKAQTLSPSRAYPQNYFRYPLDLPPTTAGSFGELRSYHFHSGLDFKTNHQIGYPVHAVADGYVSRLRVQFGGFGNAVYITHPNGYVSVYGHLDHLQPGLAKLIKDYQYQTQSYEVDFNLAPMQMPVCKDEVFAWSGNAGASAGPHLHFELRDAITQETINPQLFGLTIRDKIPPVITGLYIYHLNNNPFSEQTPKEHYLVKGAGSSFHVYNKSSFSLDGDIGFGISTYDMNSTSGNHNGVYSIVLNVDGKPVYTFAVERFAFDQTHAINAHIDFPAFETTRAEIQKNFILPGNKIGVYPQSVNRGIINFTDGKEHKLQYIVADIAGNTSTLNFTVKAGNSPIKPNAPMPGTVLFKYDKPNIFTADKIRISIAPGNLYDDLYFNYSTLPKKPGAYSLVYRVHNRFTPIHDSYDIWIKPDSTIGKLAAKAIIVNAGSVTDDNIYEDGYIKAHAHNFGDFYVMVDTTPPVIRPINITDGRNMAAARGIYFKISDNLSGIKSYTGMIDGKWVLMQWDFKTRVLSFIFDEDIKPGKHTFTLVVTDKKDNAAQFKANFYR